MLNLVEVRGQAGILSLPLEDSTLGYDIQEIQGLDPVKATLVSSSFAQQDGSQYQSSRRENRNITMKLGLYPDYTTDTVQSLRQRLYPLLMTKKAVSLRFYMDGDMTVDIDGRVESFENAMFSDTPGVDLSIMCFDPDFIDPVPVVLNGSTTSGSTMTAINYVGTVETGIDLRLSINRTLTALTIYHQTPDGTVKTMDIAGSFVSGDILTISTIPGSKSATLTRSGSDSSVLYAVSPQSNWLELDTGANGVRVYASGAAIPYTITYTRRYGGL